MRASDIGLWATCHRAWWLAKVKNAPHRNEAVLTAGVAAHAAHGAQVKRAGLLQHAAVILIVLALGALALLALALLIAWQGWL